MDLGFGDSVAAKIIYIGKIDTKCPWYFVQDGEVIPIVAATLAGYIINITIQEFKSEKFGKSQKLNIHLNAGEEYIIQSGINTWFSRTFLISFATIAPDRLQEPIIISPSVGSQGNVVFCKLYNSDKKVIRGPETYFEKGNNGKMLIEEVDFEDFALKEAEKIRRANSTIALEQAKQYYLAQSEELIEDEVF